MFRTSPKYRRLEMMMKDDVPTQSEISRQMGPSLAEVFFEYCHPDSRQLLGVIPTLEGPRNELWISPSDQLIQKVALVPPLTNKYIKACTHQGILGKEAMEQHEKNMYENIVKKYDGESGETRNMFEAEKRRAVQLAEESLRLKYEKHVDNLRQEFQHNLQAALEKAFQNCTKSMQKAVIKERIEVTRMMLKKLRDEIGYVVISLYERFENSLNSQRVNMIADFNEIVRRQNAKTDKKLREMERQKNEALQVQRNELEMQNFADVTYVLCSERMRSSSEKHAIHLYFEIFQPRSGKEILYFLMKMNLFDSLKEFKQIQALKDLLIEANNTLERSVKPETEGTAKIGDKKLREKKVTEVVREFQKFINFAFKAVPGQAEFLLCLESLLRPDTTSNDKSEAENNNLSDNEKSESLKPGTDPQFDIVEIIDSSGEKWIPVQLIPDLANLYCTKDESMSPIVKSEIELCDDKNYVKNGAARSSKSLNSNESLPFCYLDNVLYVRSDYRENNDFETKTATQLAEGSRFIMELKKGRKPCNMTISSDSSLNDSKNRSSNVKKYSTTEDMSKADEAAELTTVFEKPCTKSPFHSNSLTHSTLIGDNIKDNDINDNNESTIPTRNIEGNSKRRKNSENKSSGVKTERETFKVIGDDGIEHFQSPNDFTCARMRSLNRIFKLHPSLRQVFIPRTNEVLY